MDPLLFIMFIKYIWKHTFYGEPFDLYIMEDQINADVTHIVPYIQN